MGKWQPIETAPKDGTKILLVVAGYVPAVGWWFGERETFDFVDTEIFAEDEHWQAYIDMNCIWQPTHWMPLPEPPSDTDEIDAKLSPDELAYVQAGRAVCRALYTGIAEVNSLESVYTEGKK